MFNYVFNIQEKIIYIVFVLFLITSSFEQKEYR
jgi:hypothetical protein